MNKKTAIQIIANEKVNATLKKLDYIAYSRAIASQKLTRLNTCHAWSYVAGNFVILISYKTEVACIDTRTGTCYDYLRKVYGYTATSAQHIAKFMKKFGATNKVTYRPI